jgi:uncharacterized protein DUF955
VSDLWLTKPSSEPPALLAESIVRKLNLSPPIDIESLARESAEVNEEPWPFDQCDAVVVGLLQDRPSIFLRRGLRHRRRRFTLAHEYGHLKMAWHIGVIGCNPNSGQFEEGLVEPASNRNSVTAWWRLEEQEAEATRFASYFLMPDRRLRPLVAEMDMAQVITGLDECDVSAAAALIRLKAILQPGFCFATEDRESIRLFSSPGTSLSAVEEGSQLRSLRRASYESGKGVIGGKVVHWYRLTDFSIEDPVQDDRNTTSLVRAAIAAVESDPDRQISIYRSINGIVGGSLSKDRAESVPQVLAILRQKFRGDIAYSSIAAQPDFDLYLRRKAEEWGSRRGL